MLKFLKRPPLLLYTYITNEFLSVFFGIVIIISSVFILIKTIPLLDILLQLNASPLDFFKIVTLSLPRMLLHIVPLSSFISTIIIFSRLEYDNEILALKTCGINIFKITAPIVFVSTFISFLMLNLAEKTIPLSTLINNKYIISLIENHFTKSATAREFSNFANNIVIYIDNINEKGKWKGVYISDVRGRDTPLITIAKSGEMSTDASQMTVSVILDDGDIHNFQNNDNQVIRFNKYKLQFPLKIPSLFGYDSNNISTRDAMTSEQLLQEISKTPKDSKIHTLYISEFNYRKILPIGCVILNIIGISLGLLASKNLKAVSIAIGLFIFLAWHILTITFGNIFESKSFTSPLILWIPNFFFLILSLILIYITNNEINIFKSFLKLLKFPRRSP